MSHEIVFNFAYRNGFAVEETEQWDRPALAHNPTAAILSAASMYLNHLGSERAQKAKYVALRDAEGVWGVAKIVGIQSYPATAPLVEGCDPNYRNHRAYVVRLDDIPAVVAKMVGTNPMIGQNAGQRTRYGTMSDDGTLVLD